MSRTLFLALCLSDDFAGGLDDPDDVADAIAGMLTDSCRSAAAARALFRDEPMDVAAQAVDRVMVSAIPAPQWVTVETLRNLRAAAAGH